jgi:endonuclease YncB( thermonuclease family)
MRGWPIVWIVVLHVLLAHSALAEEFTGPVVSVLDGDTIEGLHNGDAKRNRLNAIDCPEKGQAFGKRAKQAASELVSWSTERKSRLKHSTRTSTGASLPMRSYRMGPTSITS